MASSTCETFEELLYTQRLADVNDKVRGKTIKRLKTFLKLKSSTTGFTYEDLIKIWKGLYYCMYMADKPLVQEDLAEDISKLIHHISDNSQKLLFFKVALDTFSREWNGIDKFRMDKFLMLVTRVLRQTLIFLSGISWSEGEVKTASLLLESRIICPFDSTNEKPLGLKMHITDIILEELAKIGKETLPDKVLITLLLPFFKVLAVCNDKTYVLAVKNHILYALIRQSKLGLKNLEDLSLREVELVKNPESDHELNEEDMDCKEDEDNEIVMDPRAGGVDVHLPLLRPNYNKVADALLAIASLPEIPRQKRDTLYKHANKFTTLANKRYPFSFPQVRDEIPKTKLVKTAVKTLKELENKKDSKKRKLEGDSEEHEDEDIKEGPVEIKIPKKKQRTSRKKKSKKKIENINRMKMLRKKKKMKKLRMRMRIRKGKSKDNSQKKEQVKKRSLELTNNQTILSRKLEELTNKYGSNSSSSTVKGEEKGDRYSPSVKIEKGSSSSSSPIVKIESCNSSSPTVKIEKGNSSSSPTVKIEKDNSSSSPTMKIEKDNSSSSPTVKIEKDNSSSSSPTVKIEKDKSSSSSPTVKIEKEANLSNIKLEIGNSQDRNEEKFKKSKRKLRSKKEAVLEPRPKADCIKKKINRKLLVTPLEHSADIKINMKDKMKINKNSCNEEDSRKKKEKMKKIVETCNQIKKDDWNEPLKEGEIEFEVTSKKYAKKLKVKSTLLKKSPKTNNKGRTLKINLRNNQEHEYQDYTKAVALSPGIPFSALRKPSASVLKASATPNIVRKSCAIKINRLKIKYKL